jgi:hypothetical protein
VQVHDQKHTTLVARLRTVTNCPSAACHALDSWNMYTHQPHSRGCSCLASNSQAFSATNSSCRHIAALGASMLRHLQCGSHLSGHNHLPPSPPSTHTHLLTNTCTHQTSPAAPPAYTHTLIHLHKQKCTMQPALLVVGNNLCCDPTSFTTFCTCICTSRVQTALQHVAQCLNTKTLYKTTGCEKSS